MNDANYAVVHNQIVRDFWVMSDRLSLRGKLPGTALNVLDVTVSPGGGTPPHSHASAEIFRILSGELTIWTMADGCPTEYVATAGDVVTIPAHAPHGYRNNGTGPATMMAILDDDMIAFFEDVASHRAPAGPPSPEVIERLMRATEVHGITMLKVA